MIAGAALPQPRGLVASIRRRFGDVQELAPPSFAASAIQSVQRLLTGERLDLGDIVVDLGGLGAFERSVLDAARRIPPGETRTYGDLAAAIGSPGASRAVGRALGANPAPIIIPCHRVLGADGRSGGFSAPGGTATKMRMLEIEGATRGHAPMLFDRLPWQVRAD